MVTPSNSLFAASRSKAFGLLVAGGMLFVIGIGGSGVRVGLLPLPMTQRSAEHLNGAT